MVLNDEKDQIWVGGFLLFEDEVGLKFSTLPLEFFRWFDYLLVAQRARCWGGESEVIHWKDAHMGIE